MVGVSLLHLFVESLVIDRFLHLPSRFGRFDWRSTYSTSTG